MSWIQTYTGKKFDLLNPDPASICIEDIARSLSHQNRYGGHGLADYYSVAEHSLLLADWPELPAKDRPWALLHDATEAYLVDVPKPVKNLLPEYKALEKKIQGVIAERFGLEPDIPQSVHVADCRILMDEMQQNMASPPQKWDGNFLPLGVKLQFYTFDDAEELFLRRLKEFFD